MTQSDCTCGGIDIGVGIMHEPGCHALGPTHRCEGCGESLWPDDVPEHHATQHHGSGNAVRIPCGPINELEETT